MQHRIGINNSGRTDRVRKKLGRYVVIDPKICHGQPTFRGTRILVQDVLEQVAQGLAWEAIEDQWRGAVTPAAIAEAIRLAGKALHDRLQVRAHESVAR
jgi:uncharacterized protein (DUF433 family)